MTLTHIIFYIKSICHIHQAYHKPLFSGENHLTKNLVVFQIIWKIIPKNTWLWLHNHFFFRNNFPNSSEFYTSEKNNFTPWELPFLAILQQTMFNKRLFNKFLLYNNKSFKYFLLSLKQIKILNSRSYSKTRNSKKFPR